LAKKPDVVLVRVDDGVSTDVGEKYELALVGN
jgi:hypothetical protein